VSILPKHLTWVPTKWNFRLSPFVVIQSGPPFDITVGRDLYGTTLFNARPGIAVDTTKPGLIQTKYGLLDPNPTLNQPTVSRNFGRGPGQLTVNLPVQKIFEFGKGENSCAASISQPGSGPRGGTRESSHRQAEQAVDRHRHQQDIVIT